MNYFLNHSTTVLLQFSEGRGERKEEERILTAFRCEATFGEGFETNFGLLTSKSSSKNGTTYFGVVVGRVANRISGAQFTYKGVIYKLIPNDGKNSFHGGPKGFSRVIWDVDQYYPNDPSPYVRFSYFSPDGEQGFPGNLKVKVTYKIVEGSHLSIAMEAEPLNKVTPA
ncbi:uncharacterized protein [Spinacia oleracea]|uniref:Aldose 1-epimerase n=1 Tax=Spinacia oleracea TaxID=3562 RepID=A0ABM3QYP0_SPIOL|nr:uncharacterized protein LOC110800252 [Spinacia oleracea]